MIIAKAFPIAVKNAPPLKKRRQCNCERISSDLQVQLLPLPPTQPQPSPDHGNRAQICSLWPFILFHMRKLLVVWSDSLCFDAKSMLSQFTKFCVEQNSTHKSNVFDMQRRPRRVGTGDLVCRQLTQTCHPFQVSLFEMPNSNQYDILSISIFCKITRSDMSPFLGLSTVGVLNRVWHSWKFWYEWMSEYIRINKITRMNIRIYSY